MAGSRVSAGNGLQGAAAVAGIVPVSRETVARLEGFVALLGRWQTAKNLVADSTLSDVWTRHVADSAELLRIRPDARIWLDLGSGAGFPGLVVAILLENAGEVHLVEANARKAAFLRAAAREAGAINVRVHNDRAEAVIAGWDAAPEVITARALAPFADLLALTAPLTATGADLLLHKGAGFAAEREAASAQWHFDLVEHKSRIADGILAEVRNVRRRGDRAGD